MYISEPHMDFEKFTDDTRVSPSSLSNFAECPYYYWAKRVAKFWSDKDNENFIIGGGADALITQGREAYDLGYEVTSKKRTEALKMDAKERDVQLLTVKQGKTIEAMKKELDRQPLYQKFVGGQWNNQAILETEMIDEFDGSKILGHGRFDYYHKKAQVIADLKTCANLDTFKVHYYFIQMGMYHELAKIIDGNDCQVFIIAVDKTDMTRSRIFLVSEYMIAEGKQRMRMAIDRLKVCRKTHNWGGQDIGDDKPHCCPTFDTCPYAIQKRLFTI